MHQESSSTNQSYSGSATSIMSYSLTDYDYVFPEELIAHEALKDRSCSKMLVYGLSDQKIKHLHFTSLLEELKADDLLVMNESKVIPARFYAKKVTGAKIEVLLTEMIAPLQWRAIGKPKKSLQLGMKLEILDQSGNVYPQACMEVVQIEEGPHFQVQFHIKSGGWEALIQHCAWMPLPPYIKREQIQADDFQRYQTVYSKEEGSVAAPTAGLHFTEEILEQLKDKKVRFAKVVLHVALGTFLPIQSEDIRNHQMHQESFSCELDLLDQIRATKEKGGRVICVGTTSMRVIESVAASEYQLIKIEGNRLYGKTNLFLYPGKEILVTDGLLTNFHQPKSTLMLLVSSIIGREKLLELYQGAIAQHYRLFSYGDCMLLL